MKTNSKEIFRQFTTDETFDKIIDFDTVNEMWEKVIPEYKDLVALADEDGQHTYADLIRDVAEYRGVLKDNGVEKGARVALLAVNSYEFVKLYFAIVTIGATAVVLPAHLDEMTVFGCCMKFGAKTLVYHPVLEEKTNIAKAKGIVTVSAFAKSCTEVPVAKLSGTDECVVLFTGGTTGKSKGALLSHQAVMQGTVNGCYGYRDVFNQRYILVLPLSHVFGLVRNLMTAIYTGSGLYICKNNKDMFRDIAVFRPTILVVVPALAEMALNLSKKFGRNMLGADLKYIICGAATVAPYLVTEYEKFGITLFPGYGLTESSNLVSGNPYSKKSPESVGIMYPNQEYEIVDGELWLKGRNMLTTYIGEPDENATAFSDGWFKTGDLVRFDDDGLMYITGRIKEVIVLPTGENISPAEYECKFNQLDIIQDSQVFEDFNEAGDRILALEVVLRLPEIAKLNTENVNEYVMQELEKVNASLPAFARVSKMTIRESDFARTPSMKIVRYKKCN